MKNKSVDNWTLFLDEIEKISLSDEELGFDQALKLTETPDHLVGILSQIADKVRRKYSSDKVDLCSIINARSGKCQEDCKFCSQSKHYNAEVHIYPMKTVEEIVESAKKAQRNGAHRFCIVTSGKQLSNSDFQIALEAIKQIGNETKLKRCASMGRLSLERARALKEAGLSRYHHNIETASSFFPDICTTHSYEEKIETINNLKKAGIQTCIGGILNLGETPRQRIEFSFELKKLNPDSVPINFLNPRPKTPLADRPLMGSLEAVKYLAIFRLILPKAYIRLAGGRAETFREDLAEPFQSGVNALLIGDLLTTKGPGAKSDISILESLGFDVSPS